MRFSGFDDEWKSFKLSEISKRITRKNKSLETDRPLTISAQYGLVDQIEYFNKIVASKSLKGYYLLNKGEFAYNKSYSNGYPFGAVKRLDDYENGAISTLYICFNTNDKMNSDLLKEYFETDKWHKEIYKIAVEGARNHGLLNVAVGDFFNTKHVLPTNNHEQEKIAKFLIEINTKIDLLENKHKAYQDFKKYLMQKIFAQELRFDFKDTWDKVLLKDVAFIPKKTKLTNVEGLKLLTVKLHTKGIEINDRIKPKLTKRGRPYYIRRSGELLIGRQNFHNGGMGIVPKSLDGGICSNAISSFNVFEDKIDVNYLYYFLARPEYYIKSERLIGGTGQKEFSEKELLKLKIDLPSLEEQNKIVDFLLNIDHKIELSENQLNKTQEFKKGLLQQMFVVQLILSLLQNKKHI